MKSAILAGFLLQTCRGAGLAMGVRPNSLGEDQLAVAGEAEPVFLPCVQQNRLARAAQKLLHFNAADRGGAAA